jgi:hypothetical protein
LDAVRQLHEVRRLEIDDPHLESVVAVDDHQQVGPRVAKRHQLGVESIGLVHRPRRTQCRLVDGDA